MPLVSFLGNALIVFGPLCAIFFGYIYQHSQLVVISVISPLFYIISLFFISLFWVIFPLKSQELFIISIIIGVMIHEFFRFLLYILYIKTNNAFESSTKKHIYDSPYGMIPIGTACGIGYAFSRSLITYGTVLSFSYQPGTLYTSSCNNINFFLASSLTVLFIELTEIGLMVLSFEGYNTRNYLKIIVTIFLHFISSGITALNVLPNSCYYTMPSLFIISMISLSSLIVQIIQKYRQINVV